MRKIRLQGRGEWGGVLAVRRQLQRVQRPLRSLLVHVAALLRLLLRLLRPLLLVLQLLLRLCCGRQCRSITCGGPPEGPALPPTLMLLLLLLLLPQRPLLLRVLLRRVIFPGKTTPFRRCSFS